MARPLRIEFAGALYHLTSRGDGNEAIFIDDEDRQILLEVLASVVTRLGWRIYAYCLMGNHYHLLTETPAPSLSRGMRQLNGVYTQRFNRRHARVGHVFQGRFKAILVETSSYLIELARHVVLNPVRVGTTGDFQTYLWSSYLATAGLQPAPHWLDADRVLSHFGAVKATAQPRYVAFVQAGAGLPTVWNDLRHQIYLGSDLFVSQMQGLVRDSPTLSEVPRKQRQAPVKLLDDYANTHADAPAAMVAAYRSGDFSLAAIGRHFGVHYSTVSRTVRAAEQKS